MRKILLLLGLGLVALTGCKKDSSSLEESLIANLVMPEGPFAPGASVTIQGSGFTSADEIWFRTPTKANGDIQATVTHQAANELTFTVPQVPAGEHAVVLKRGEKEMPLGKLTVSEAAATKLYAFGSPDDEENYVLWEIDKATGELMEIVQIPTSENEGWGSDKDSPVVDPVSGNIYYYKWTETENSEQVDLYRFEPSNKTLKKIGLLDQIEAEDTRYDLCIVDGQLHALIEKWKDSDEDDLETFYSLVSINPETAEQTVVADFGSLEQALNDISAGFYDDVNGQYLYDKTTHSLILSIVIGIDHDCCQLVRLDIANKKIIAGEKFNNHCITLFLKDSKVCGAFYNDDINTVDFRLIDTEKLTAGNSIGSATLETDSFKGPWCYDASTGKAFGQFWKESDAGYDYSVFGAFDFNTQKVIEIKEYASEIGFDLFQ